MAILINAYCTHRQPPPLDFACQNVSRRDGSDPELPTHLNGFCGYPPDARARRERTLAQLGALGVRTSPGLPPVVSEVEVELRQGGDVARRALALFVVALRGESLAGQEPISLAKLRQLQPQAFLALSPSEEAFLNEEAPTEQAVVNAAWRYEALAVLQWALGWVEELPFPSRICDVPATARLMVEGIAGRTLRATSEILDALDLHLRLNWAVRQARLEAEAPPTGLDPGVLEERHHALNWLVRFQDADWDEVETPT